MALVKNDAKTSAPAAGPASTNLFENDSPAAAAPAADAAAKVGATTAIATAQSTAVIASGAVKPVLQDLENALPDVGFGVLPRLVGTNGMVMDQDKTQMGPHVSMVLVSWNYTYVISPGDDSAEAKAAVRYSRDGKTIDDTGESVAAYIDQLKTVSGYTDASSKKYVQLIGIIEAVAKGDAHVGEMVEVSLSPQSAKLFDGYRLQRSVQVRLGRAPADGAERIKIEAEVKTQGSNTFTLLKVSAQ